MRYAQGFLLIYSVTSRYSLDAVEQLREQILRVKDADEFPMVLVGDSVCCRPLA